MGIGRVLIVCQVVVRSGVQGQSAGRWSQVLRVLPGVSLATSLRSILRVSACKEGRRIVVDHTL